MNERGFWKLGQVSDEALLAGLRELLAAEGRNEARVVAHLAEVDERRIALKQAQSLYEYCQKQLGFSDNQAYYRIAAARVARRFPLVFELLERRQIHLVNIAPLAKHLTVENHRELLDEAGRLSKRELLKCLARRYPRPDATSEIRRLVPQPGSASAGPTGSLEPLSASTYRLQLNTSEALKEKLELARDLMSHANPTGDLAVVVERALDLLIERLKSRRFGLTSRPKKSRLHPAMPVVSSPSDEAQPANLAQSVMGSSGAAVPRQGHPWSDDQRRLTNVGPAPAGTGAGAGAQASTSADRSPRPSIDLHRSMRSPLDIAKRSDHPAGPSDARPHITHQTRRDVVARDGLRCTFVAPNGCRCTARGFLELDHRLEFSKGGGPTARNMRVMCRAHNQLLAELAYGRPHIEAAKKSRR